MKSEKHVVGWVIGGAITEQEHAKRRTETYELVDQTRNREMRQRRGKTEQTRTFIGRGQGSVDSENTRDFVTSYINIVTWNVNGLSKLNDDQSVKNYLKTFDIIGIVETWGNFKNEFDSFLTDFGNVRSRNRHAIRNSGGVSVFIKETLFQSGFVQQILTDFSDSIVLLLKTSLYENMNNDILFYITYISPEGSTIFNNLHESNGILN